MVRPSSRRYVKRIWRVPADRGALEFFASLVTKALVKHGWPARWQAVPFTDGFEVLSHDHGADLPPDFVDACQIAFRITARAYGAEVDYYGTFCALTRDYEVTPRRQLREIKR